MSSRRSALLSVISLVVFIVGIGVWIRGYFVRDTLAIWRWSVVSSQPPAKMGQTTVAWDFSCGSISFSRYRIEVQTTSTFPQFGWKYYGTPPVSLFEESVPSEQITFRFAGFQLRRNAAIQKSGSTSMQELILPIWLILLTAIPPLQWLRHRAGKNDRGFVVSTPTSPGD